jgi:hypothetical protein
MMLRLGAAVARASMRSAAAGLLASRLVATVAAAQGTPHLTSPREQFGFDIGADYHLVNYSQVEAYWKLLATQSDRLKVEQIGTTAEGRPIWMLIISAPENLPKLDRYRQISARLARADGVSEGEARALAAEGRAIVWIDGGLHADEVLGAQQLIETAWQLVSHTDTETQRFLRDDVVLMTLVNPDGMELVSDWYNRTADTLQRSTGGLPRLYQKYIGHDNNRDFYIANQPETQAINGVFYRSWYPQIVYNHHQTGPAGTVMFAPPFRDPFSYAFDPLVVTELDLVGAAIHSRFEAEGKPGVTMRSGSSYSTWWNGGLRTMVYFHNQVGLLTETIGNPTPETIPFVPANALPRADLPFPIGPQVWHFRQSIDYSVTANRAVLDVASRYRETLLFNAWRMGRNAIERGSTDTWITTPHALAAVQAEVAKAGEKVPANGTVPIKYYDLLRRPEDRLPRAYILPADQPDVPTMVKFVNALWRGGIDVDRATAPFTAAGHTYPAGSYIVRTAQAFRPHILDMFEPQDHPNDLQYPGGPPKPPYDNAGWTLAYQMGVRFDRVLDAFDAPTDRLTTLAAPAGGSLARGGAGWFLSHATNDGFIAVNRLLRAKQQVFWLEQSTHVGAATYPAGTWYIPVTAAARGVLQPLADSLGLVFAVAPSRPAVPMKRMAPVRVGLWDQYGGSMPSGWTRWLLEQYGFDYELVFPQQLDAGDLRTKYDVLLFPSGAIPLTDAAMPMGDEDSGQPKAESIPAEFRPRLGRLTIAKTIPQLRQFLLDGGTVLTVGSSGNLAYHLDLPVQNQLTELVRGEFRPLGRDKVYVPGSVLRARVDTSMAIAAGVGHDGQVDVFFNASPVFRLSPDAAARGLRASAWFDNAHPLRSGWALGEAYLDRGVQAFEAPVGAGRLYVFAPEITFRAQPHGTFKFLFNGILLGAATAAR